MPPRRRWSSCQRCSCPPNAVAAGTGVDRDAATAAALVAGRIAVLQDLVVVDVHGRLLALVGCRQAPGGPAWPMRITAVVEALVAGDAVVRDLQLDRVAVGDDAAAGVRAMMVKPSICSASTGCGVVVDRADERTVIRQAARCPERTLCSTKKPDASSVAKIGGALSIVSPVRAGRHVGPEPSGRAAGPPPCPG